MPFCIFYQIIDLPDRIRTFSMPTQIFIPRKLSKFHPHWMSISLYHLAEKFSFVLKR